MLPGVAASLLFHRVAASGVDPAGLDWLRATGEQVAAGDVGLAAPAFVSAGRRLGRGPLAPGEPLPGADDPVPTTGWSVDDAGRAVILLSAADPALTDQLYREGDSREKRAVVRALPLLPDGGRLLAIALDAGRTNESDLFAALACGNPYPGRHYPEAAWNQLVMKAAFVGAPLAEIVGLDRRGNRELCRMALDFADQQESAGRPLPAAFDRLVASAGEVDLADRAARDGLRRRLEEDPP